MPNGQYQLGELLGRGGMGEVHAARHRSGRLVAVKRVRNTLSSDQLMVERLTDEARLLRTVSHPNVVRALDHGTDGNGMPYLVMDRAYGTPLNQLIDEHGPLPHERVAAIASQLFAGLIAIHEARIVHADLKSHNVLVDDVDIVTIIDFGLARTVVEEPGDVGLVAGTPAYMAPEVIAGAYPTVAADIYAAGAIIYEMLTASTPFSGHISEILSQQLCDPVEPPSRRAPDREITPAIDRVVLRALDASPGVRFPTVAAFADAFQRAFGRPAVPPPAADFELWLDEPTERRSRRPAPAIATERPLDRPIQRRIRTDERTAAIIATALGKAQRLIEGRRLTEAVEALEAGLAALAPGVDGDASSDTWRIETVLAALYDTTGKQDRARRMAMVAYRHALRSGCAQAEARASELIERLTARSPRLARGSMSDVRGTGPLMGSATGRPRGGSNDDR
jgi:serine/threonine protein kinase